jgi:hypothetical protein
LAWARKISSFSVHGTWHRHIVDPDPIRSFMSLLNFLFSQEPFLNNTLNIVDNAVLVSDVSLWNKHNECNVNFDLKYWLERKQAMSNNWIYLALWVYLVFDLLVSLMLSNLKGVVCLRKDKIPHKIRCFWMDVSH